MLESWLIKRSNIVVDNKLFDRKQYFAQHEQLNKKCC